MSSIWNVCRRCKADRRDVASSDMIGSSAIVIIIFMITARRSACRIMSVSFGVKSAVSSQRASTFRLSYWSRRRRLPRSIICERQEDVSNVCATIRERLANIGSAPDRARLIQKPGSKRRPYPVRIDRFVRLIDVMTRSKIDFARAELL